MQNALPNSVAEADKRGKAEMVNEAMQWVKSHEPAPRGLRQFEEYALGTISLSHFDHGGSASICTT